MNTLALLEAVKTRRKITSDYALAKALGVTQQAVSSYRSGNSIINDDVCLTVATILEIPPIGVIAQANAERAKTPELRQRWMELVQGFRLLLPHAKFAGQERRRMVRTPLRVVTA
jgi:transcriptional regulator with XRE-family HTH domain